MAARLRPQLAWRRGAAWVAVLLVVLALHAWLSDRLVAGWLAAQASAAPARLSVAFVRELRPAQPAPPPQPRPPPQAKGAPPAVASAPSPPASAPLRHAVTQQAIELLPVLPEPMLDAQAPPWPGLPPVVAATPSAASSPAREVVWPPSTELQYHVTGNVRGPVEGWAEVRWIRRGTHYQVHMDTRVALFATRQVTSDGEITGDGLQPQRYDQETQLLFGTPRRETVLFDGHEVTLSNGSRVQQPPGVQDSASQLVQLVWRFTTDPALLAPGRSVTLPVALPARVDPWTFDVMQAEPVPTPFGEVPAWHVKPQRPAGAANVITVEGWFAPTLQYLPVRLRVEQRPGTYLDLWLKRPPLQAAEPAASGL